MTVAIGFPLVGNAHDNASAPALACYLWEYVGEDPQKTVVVHFGSESRRTTLSNFLGDSYQWADDLLRAASRTVLIEIGGAVAGGGIATAEALIKGQGEVSGGSAGLALCLACHWRLPVRPSGGSPIDAYVLLTGRVEGSQRVTTLPLDPVGLVAKLRFVEDWVNRRNQVLVVTQCDIGHLSGSALIDDWPTQAPVWIRDRSAKRCIALPVSFWPALKELAQWISLEQVLTVPLAEPAEEPVALPAVEATSQDKRSGLFFRDLLLAALGTDNLALDQVARAKAYIEDPQDEELSRLLARPLDDFEIQLDAMRRAAELFGAADSDIGSDTRNVLVSGPTGSGKTALIDALVLRSILHGEGMCLYLAPTRALASEYSRNFSRRYGKLIDYAKQRYAGETASQRIALSTGEDTEHDVEVLNAEVDLACLVFEKANVLSARGYDALTGHDSRLRLVVADELHMITDVHRGGVLDLLLSKLRHSAMHRLPERPLRIAGVTTEAFAADFAADDVRAFHSMGEGSEPRVTRPICLVARRRPVPVDHLTLLIAPDAAGVATQPEQICLLQQDSDRVLSDDALMALAGRMHQTARVLTDSGASALPGGHDHFFSEVILRQIEAGYQSIILARGSADGLFSIAHQLAAKLPSADSESFAAIKQRIEQADVTSMRKKHLLDAAAKGIFIHSSDQPRPLREAVEEFFSASSQGIAVLLTTETLSYGVNLSADCVVLASPWFPRENRNGPGVRSMKLSVNAFHNLLGRAGRFGHKMPNGVARALVLIEDAYKRKEKRRVETPTQGDLFRSLKKYYGASESRRYGMSALFLPRDDELGVQGMSELARAKKQLVTPSRPTDIPSDVDLAKAASFNAFRTICDGLRYLSIAHDGDYPPDPNGLTRFLLDWTTYSAVELGVFSSQASREQENERLGLESFVPRLVRGLSELGFLRFDAAAQLYELTEQAEALINTGVRPSAVAPIRHFLGLIENRSEDLPIDIVALAFCSVPEFWNAAAGDLCQVMYWTQLPTHGLGRLTEERLIGVAKKRLHSCAAVLGVNGDTLIDLAAKQYSATIEADARGLQFVPSKPNEEGNQTQPRLNEASYFNLCAIVIGWLAGWGEDRLLKWYWADEVDGKPREEGPASSKRPHTFKVQLAEKLGWLARMTYNYFAGDVPMPGAIRAELLPFSQRCRLGVPEKCVRYMTGLEGDETASMLDMPSRTVAVMHAESVADASLAIAELKDPMSDWGRRARRFYEREIRDKLRMVLPADSLPQREARGTLVNALARATSVADEVGLDIFVWAAVRQWVDDIARPNVCEAVDQIRVVKFSLPGGHDGELRFGDHRAKFDPPATVSLRVCMPYEGQMITEPCVSLFGAIALLGFSIRGIFSAEAARKVGESSPLLTVRSVVTELGNLTALTQLPRLREALLSFREPSLILAASGSKATKVQ